MVECIVALFAGFASCMRQLHSGDATLLMNEANNSRQWFNVVVAPDAEILRTDSRLGQNRRCFGKYQPSSTDGAAAQMDEMPVVRKSLVARILAHGRDKHAVGKVNVSNR